MHEDVERLARARQGRAAGRGEARCQRERGQRGGERGDDAVARAVGRERSTGCGPLGPPVGGVPEYNDVRAAAVTTRRGGFARLRGPVAGSPTCEPPPSTRPATSASRRSRTRVIEEPTDAIVKVVAGCICGSDLWPYRGDNDIDAGVDDRPRVRRRGRGGRQRRSRTSRAGDFVIVPFCHCDNTCAHCARRRAVGLRQPRLHRERPGRVRPRHPGRRQPGEDRRDARRRR